MVQHEILLDLYYPTNKIHSDNSLMGSTLQDKSIQYLESTRVE
jgi:hypothetical protein